MEKGTDRQQLLIKSIASVVQNVPKYVQIQLLLFIDQ
jgi:hypothetical protein